MTDANVTVTFSASTSDFESGIASARDALASLAGPIADISGKYAALGAALTESHAHALQAMQSGDSVAYAQALRTAQEAISGQIKAEQDGLREKLAAYADDARNHRMTEQEKLQIERIASRLRSVAQDLRLSPTVGVEWKEGHLAYLQSEAFLLDCLTGKEK